MKTSYISYFEGHDALGAVIYNGNGTCSVEYDEVEGINPVDLLENHGNYLLGLAQEGNANVVRVTIKNLIRL